MGRLQGKVAIVTGGARGMGAATSRLFAAEGAKVAIADLLDESGAALAAELGPVARFYHHDVTDEADWARLVAKVEAELGPVDVLVNNAGILLFRTLLETSVDEYERVLRVNLVGEFLGIRTVAPGMIARGKGSIVNISSVDANRTNAVRVALQYDRQGAFRANYAYDYNHNKGYPAAFQLTAARPDLVAFFAGSPAAGGGVFTVSPDRLDTIALDHNGAITDEIHAHTLTLAYDLSDSLTLKSITGYRKWRQEVTDSDFDGNADLLGPIVGLGPTPGPVELFGSSGLRHQHQWSQEFNLIGKAAGVVDYVLGAYYFDEKADEYNPQRFSVILPIGALPLMSLLNYNHESSTAALFAQGTWRATDRLSLTGGVRYTWDTKRLVQTAPLVRDLEKSFDKFNWAATVDYKFTDDVMAYARIATGYKAGGFNARSFDQGFGPEDLTSYELGVKSELLDRRLRLNATAYYADHKDVQVTSFEAGAAGATAVTVNAGKAVYQGVELEVSAAPTQGLTTYASLGYVDREYKEFLFFDATAGRTIDISGIAKFPYSASTTVNAGIQYEFPRLSFGILSTRMDYSYMSKRYFNSNPLSAPFNEQMAAAPRGLLDVRVTLSELQLAGGDASVSLWGRNITNAEYRAVGIDFGQLGFAGNVYGEPATYGVDLNVKF